MIPGAGGGRPFRWTACRERAADLIADGRLSRDEIGAEVGVDRRTLSRWAARPEFRARVEKHLDEFRARLRAGLLKQIADTAAYAPPRR